MLGLKVKPGSIPFVWPLGDLVNTTANGTAFGKVKLHEIHCWLTGLLENLLYIQIQGNPIPNFMRKYMSLLLNFLKLFCFLLLYTFLSLFTVFLHKQIFIIITLLQIISGPLFFQDWLHTCWLNRKF